MASHPLVMVFAPPSPHPATFLNSASGPVSDSRSTVTSYVSVEPPGTSAYGERTALGPNPSSGGTDKTRVPPTFMPCTPCFSPRGIPGTGSVPATRTITGRASAGWMDWLLPLVKNLAPPRVVSTIVPSDRVAR